MAKRGQLLLPGNNDRMRRDGLKLCQGRFRLNKWLRLRKEVVESPSLGVFKSHGDVALRDMVSGQGEWVGVGLGESHPQVTKIRCGSGVLLYSHGITWLFSCFLFFTKFQKCFFLFLFLFFCLNVNFCKKKPKKTKKPKNP